MSRSEPIALSDSLTVIYHDRTGDDVLIQITAYGSARTREDLEVMTCQGLSVIWNIGTLVAQEAAGICAVAQINSEGCVDKSPTQG